jgi:hypothetical protein
MYSTDPGLLKLHIVRPLLDDAPWRGLDKKDRPFRGTFPEGPDAAV